METQEALDECLKLISGDKHIAVDTEFIRDEAYYPRLSLIQISGKKVAFAIDVLKELNLVPLCEIFKNPKIIKIFHDCKQDLEVLYYHLNIELRNIFDTQIAALFLGFNEAPSYVKLISHYLNINVDKKLQYSKWLQRPLSDEHLTYALNDVELLYKIFSKMHTELKIQNKYAWAREEFKSLSTSKKFLLKESDLLMKLLIFAYSKDDLIRLLHLARFREKTARLINLNRNYIASNNLLGKAIRNNKLYNRIIKKCEQLSGEVFQVIDTAQFSDSDKSLVNKVYKFKNFQRFTKSKFYTKLLELLIKTGVKYNIAPSLIANSSDILKLSAGYFKNNKVLKGWRNEIFGEGALKFIQTPKIKDIV